MPSNKIILGLALVSGLVSCGKSPSTGGSGDLDPGLGDVFVVNGQEVSCVNGVCSAAEDIDCVNGVCSTPDLEAGIQKLSGN